MKITQVELINQFSPCAYHKQICWLPSDKYKLRIGMRLELEGDDSIWTIHEIYSTQEHYEINRKWDVGGL